MNSHSNITRIQHLDNLKEFINNRFHKISKELDMYNLSKCHYKKDNLLTLIIKMLVVMDKHPNNKWYIHLNNLGNNMLHSSSNNLEFKRFIINNNNNQILLNIIKFLRIQFTISNTKLSLHNSNMQGNILIHKLNKLNNKFPQTDLKHPFNQAQWTIKFKIEIVIQII